MSTKKVNYFSSVTFVKGISKNGSWRYFVTFLFDANTKYNNHPWETAYFVHYTSTMMLKNETDLPAYLFQLLFFC